MIRTLFLALPLGLVALSPGLADDGQDRARAALAAGRILPLSEILARIEPLAPGRVIEVDYDEDDDDEEGGGRGTYEIEILMTDGRLLELEVDARSGAILDREYEDDD